jgi:hypothetical protein
VEAKAGSSFYHYVDQNAARLGEEVYYRLMMKYADGQHAYSAMQQVKFSVQLQQVVLIPNPAKDRVTIQGAGYFKQLRVVDIHGKLVLERAVTSSNQEINISTLAAGAYTVQLVNGSRIESLKLIKE